MFHMFHTSMSYYSFATKTLIMESVTNFSLELSQLERYLRYLTVLWVRLCFVLAQLISVIHALENTLVDFEDF